MSETTKIQDSFIDAIDYLIAQRLTELPLDKTITCTIEEKDDTGYWVTDGTVRFHVNSDNKDYQPKWQVIVLIPGGDYSSEEKTILSRKGLSQQAEKIIPYVKPSEQIIPVGVIKITNDSPIKLGDQYKNCNSMSISAKVKTTFDERITNGEYSLVVKISDGEKFIIAKLNNKEDMFGDTYRFYVPLPQEAAYKIDFSSLDMKNAKITYTTEVNGLNAEDIVFSGITITLGYDVVTEELNSIKIVEEGKNLRALWYNKTEENKYIEDGSVKYDWEISPDQKIWQKLENTTHTIANPMVATWQHTYVRVSVELKSENEEDEPIVYISEIYDIENNIDLGVTQLGDTVIFSGMEIIHGTDSRDSYNCYGYTNMVVDAEDHKRRTLSRKAILKDIYKVDETPTFSSASKTYWYVPEVSMIKTTFSAIADADAKDKAIDGYNIYSADEEGDFTYTIASWFMPYASVSEIICRVYPNDNETKEYFEAKKQISFTTKGSQGTDYSFILVDENTAKLFDPQGQEITDIKPTIIWPDPPPGIAYATVDVPDTSLTLKTYLPVAAQVANYVYAGPREIIYDSFGANPKYDESLFHFVGETESRGWSYGGKNVSSINDIISELQFYKADNKVIVTHENGWQQPIFLYQDIYGNSYLNEWDGKVQIDNDKNKILASMIGAGYKDNNNAFHGVLMGKVQDGDNQQTGIFGYHEGAQSFGFRNDGTAFIGKNKEGRIYLNGNDSTISGDSESMSIDLKNSTIKAPNFELIGTEIEKEIEINGKKEQVTIGPSLVIGNKGEEEQQLTDGISYNGQNKEFTVQAKNFGLYSPNVEFDNSKLILISSPAGEENSNNAKQVLKITDKEYALKSRNYGVKTDGQVVDYYYKVGTTNKPIRYTPNGTAVDSKYNELRYITNSNGHISSYYGTNFYKPGNEVQFSGNWLKVKGVDSEGTEIFTGTTYAGDDSVGYNWAVSSIPAGFPEKTYKTVSSISGMMIDIENGKIEIWNNNSSIIIGNQEKYNNEEIAFSIGNFRVNWNGEIVSQG